MNQKELSALTDEELLKEAKKTKASPMINALLVGFLIGIIAYSIMVSNVGFFTLIPLFFIYKLVNSSKEGKELEKVLEERGLK